MCIQQVNDKMRKYDKKEYQSIMMRKDDLQKIESIKIIPTESNRQVFMRLYDVVMLLNEFKLYDKEPYIDVIKRLRVMYYKGNKNGKKNKI